MLLLITVVSQKAPNGCRFAGKASSHERTHVPSETPPTISMQVGHPGASRLCYAKPERYHAFASTHSRQIATCLPPGQIFYARHNNQSRNISRCLHTSKIDSKQINPRAQGKSTTTTTAGAGHSQSKAGDTRTRSRTVRSGLQSRRSL